MKKFKPSMRYDMIHGFVANPAPPPKRARTTTNSLTVQIADYVAMRAGPAAAYRARAEVTPCVST